MVLSISKRNCQEVVRKNEVESCSVVSDSLWHHGLYSPWNSPGQNAGVGSRSLLQGIFPTQGLNPGLPHCRRILYQLSHKGSPRILEWVAYPFSSGSSWPRNQTGVSCIAGRFFSSWATRKWYLCHGIYVRKWYLKPSQTFYNFMLKGNVLPFWSTDRVLDSCHWIGYGQLPLTECPPGAGPQAQPLWMFSHELSWCPPFCRWGNWGLERFSGLPGLTAQEEAELRFQFRSPGGGCGNPLQYSCLENPMDRGVWGATVHGVAKSQTWSQSYTYKLCLRERGTLQIPLM